MKKFKKLLLNIIVIGILIVAGIYTARPYMTMRRVEAHLASQPPGSVGPMFDAVNKFDRPEDVLGALWRLTCDHQVQGKRSAEFILALIAMEELSLAVPLEISEEYWRQSLGDFMAGLNIKSGMTDGELLIQGDLRRRDQTNKES